MATTSQTGKIVITLMAGSCGLLALGYPDWKSEPRAEGDDPFLVRPILTCVVEHEGSSFTAVFGYENTSNEIVNIPVGANNRFPTDPEDRDQPASFRPGRHKGVFEAIFSERLVWKLGENMAVASKDSPRCSLKCPREEGIDLDGECVPLEQDTGRVIKEDDVSDTGPDFGSPEESVQFIIDTVRSEGLGDADTNVETQDLRSHLDHPIELSGRLTLPGPVFVPHEDGTIEEFDDKFALLLGGRSGFFTVDGKEVCVRDDGCFDGELEDSASPQQQQQRPRDVTVCDSELCTTNSSFSTNVSFLFRYCSRGGETRQSAGGYRENTRWCLKFGFIPWRCTTKEGTNRLALNVSFLGSPLGNHFKSEVRRDVTALTAKIYSFDFGLSTAPFECTVPVVCTDHESAGNSFSRSGPDNRFVFAQTGVDCSR